MTKKKSKKKTMAALVKGSKKRKTPPPAERRTAAKSRKKLGIVKPAELGLYAVLVVVQDVIAKKYLRPPYQREDNLWVGRGGSVGNNEMQYVESCMATNSVPGVFYFCTINKGEAALTAHEHILDGLQRLSTLVRLYERPREFGYTPQQVKEFFATAQMHVTKYHFKTIADAIEMFRRINDYGVKATDYEIFSGWLKTTIDGRELIEEVDKAMCEVDAILMGQPKAEKLTLAYAAKNSKVRTKNHRLFRTSLALFLTYVEDNAEPCIMPKHAHRNQPEVQVEYKLAAWLKTVTIAEAKATVAHFRNTIRRTAQFLRLRQKEHLPEKKDHAWSVTAARAMFLISLKFRLRVFKRIATWYMCTFRAQDDWPSRAYLAEIPTADGGKEIIAVPQTTPEAIDWRLYGDDISAVADLPQEFFYDDAEIEVEESKRRKKPALLDGQQWSHIIAQNGGTPGGDEELYGVTVPENATENLLRGNRDMSKEEREQFADMLAAKKKVAAERERQLSLLERGEFLPPPN